MLFFLTTKWKHAFPPIIHKLLESINIFSLLAAASGITLRIVEMKLEESGFINLQIKCVPAFSEKKWL